MSPSTEGSSPGRPLSTGAKQSSGGSPLCPQGPRAGEGALESRRLGHTARRHPPRRWGWQAACPGPAAGWGTPAGCASGPWLAPVTERRATIGTRPGNLDSRPCGRAAAGPEARSGGGQGRRQHGGPAPGERVRHREGRGRASVLQPPHTRRRPTQLQRHRQGWPVSSRRSDGDEIWGMSCCCNADFWGP